MPVEPNPEPLNSLLPVETRERTNMTLLEGQGYAMLLARVQGRSISQIAIQFGIAPGLVDEMIERALRESLATKRNQEFQVGLLSRLMELDEELGTMNKRLRLKGKLRHTELPKTGVGEPVVLWEEVNNVAEKRKLISERRMNALAVKSILACDPGEIPSAEREEQMAEIMGAMRDVSQEVTRELASRVATEAREAGRLEERAKGRVIDIKPEDDPEDKQ